MSSYLRARSIGPFSLVLTLLAAVALALPCASSASGILNFEDRAAGFVYEDMPGSEIQVDSFPQVFAAGAGRTSSGTNAAAPIGTCAMNFLCGTQQFRFTTPVSSVSMRIGSSRMAVYELGIPVQLIAYTRDGERRFSDIELLPGGRAVNIAQSIQVTSPEADIVRVVMYSGVLPSGGGVGVKWATEFDDVRWVTGGGTSVRTAPPTVTITDPTADEVIASAENVRVTGTVVAPGGVGEFCVKANATARPAACNQRSRVVNGRYSIVLPSSELRLGRNTVSAWVMDEAGRPHATMRTFRVADASDGIDVAVESMELVQSIGAPRLAQSQVNGSDIVNLPVGGGRGVPFTDQLGALNITGKRTVVRVYPSVRSVAGRTITSIPAVPARLRAWRYSALLNRYIEMPGGPIQPLRAPRTITAVSPRANFNDVRGAGAGYWFELPMSWTSANTVPALGRADLVFVAELNSPDMAPRVAECDSAQCSANSRAMLRGVRFAEPHPTEIRSIAVNFTDVQNDTLDYGPGPARANDAFDATRSILPVSPTSLRVRDYVMSIDAGWMINCTAERMAAGQCSGVAEVDLQNAIRRYTQDRPTPDGVKWFGLSDRGVRGQASVWLDDSLGWTYLGEQGHASTGRPITSLTHELTHMMGASHASFCGGAGLATNGLAEMWIPSTRGDTFGSILGIGVDLRDGSSTDLGATPFRVYNDDRPRSTAPGVTDNGTNDLMSYCVNPDDVWISPYNWARVAFVNTFPRDEWDGQGGSGDGYDWDDQPVPGAPALQQPVNSGATPRPAANPTTTGGPVPALVVTASATQNGSSAMIDPLRATVHALSAPALADSPWAFVAYDGTDTVLGSYRAVVAVGNGDHDGSNDSPQLMTGWLPATTARVELVRDGATSMSKRTRSKYTPELDVKQPATGSSIDGALTVTWTVSDKDAGDMPLVDVEVSTDGGGSFTTVAAMLPGTTTTIPAERLPRAANSIVRVVASDGFNAQIVDVPNVALAGHPPQVVLAAPHAAKGPVRLTTASEVIAEAWGFDDAGAALTKFAWTLDGKKAGSGAQVSLADLTKGRHLLTVTGTDYAGRTTSATQELIVAARALTLVDADADPGANGVVRFQIEGSEPMTIQIKGSRVVTKLGLDQKSFKVDLGAKTPAVVTAKLTANGVTKLVRIPVDKDKASTTKR